MRLLLPRFDFWFALIFLAGGVSGVLNIQTRQGNADLLGAWIAVVIGCAYLTWAGVCVYSLRLVGVSCSMRSAMQKGNVCVIGPLFGLAQTQFILAFQPSSLFRSYRLYRYLTPECPEPRYLLQLFGRDGQRETLLSSEYWPDAKKAAPFKGGAPQYMKMNVTEKHESYFLRVQLKDVPDENAPFETMIKIGVALRMRDAARWREPNLGAARLEKVA